MVGSLVVGAIGVGVAPARAGVTLTSTCLNERIREGGGPTNKNVDVPVHGCVPTPTCDNGCLPPGLLHMVSR